MKRYILITVLFVWHVLAMAEIITQVEPNKAQMSDTIRLILTANDASSASDVPDLTPLQHSFNVVGTQQSMSYRLTNGQAQAATQWVILLMAKRAGTLPIPPIQIGKQQSTATQIAVMENKVSAAPNPQTSSPQDALLLKTEVSKNNPFINEQVIYTVKLYHKERLVDADYQPPSIEDALLFPLGDGKNYQEVLNGQTYAVEEQQYAVFPQKSGTLKLVAPTFHALIYDGSAQRVRAFAKTIELQVKPIPSNDTSQQWLPAKQVKLTEVYANHDVTIIEGSTLVRTVTLQAVGVPAQLLSDLVFSDSEHFNIYPEKPEIDNAIRQHELISRTSVKVTYLLNKPGQVTIPELRFIWFNTVTGKEEVALLPAHTLEIKPHAVTSQPAVTPPDAHQVVSVPTPMLIPPATSSLAWWVAGGFALAWMATLFIWWFSHRSLGMRRGKRLALKRLHDACSNNNPTQTRVALLHWASLRWPDAEILNITDLTRVVHDSPLKKQLQLLSQALYSQDGKIAWQGDKLWHSVVAHRPMKSTKKNKGRGLPPINPF